MSTIDFFKKQVIFIISRTKLGLEKFKNTVDLNKYRHSDRRPWSRGYDLYKNKYLEEILNDSSSLDIFLSSRSLPGKLWIST